jgi:PAS domain S-box-containing protein
LEFGRKFLKNSVVVVLVTASATALRYVFHTAVEDRAPILFHILAIALASEICGTVSGIVVTVLSVVSLHYLFLPPQGLGWASDPHYKVTLLLFSAVGMAFSIFGGRRKRAEEETERIRYNLEIAQQIGSVGSWESDIKGNLWWSHQTFEIFGVPPQNKVRIQDFYDLVHPEDRDAVRRAVEAALESSTGYDIEHRIVRRSDGQLRIVRQQAKVIRHGPTLLIGSIKDETEARRGEMAQQILGGLLQVCSSCRRIRDADKGDWYSMEGYLRLHSTARFSHGMCPDCGKQWYPNVFKKGDEPG